MCPACLEALALLIVGVSSTGTVAALLAGKFRGESTEKQKNLLQGQNNEEGSCQKQPTST
jgi:hypothetical protein